MTNAVIIAQQGSNNTTFRNRIINGAMGIWQRATTYNMTASWVYGSVDRWISTSFPSTNGVFNRSTSVPTGFQYSVQMGRTAASSATSPIQCTQAIESVNCYGLAGQTATLSFWAKAGANFSASGNILASQIGTGTVADEAASSFYSWTGGVQTAQNNTLTTTWTRYTYTVTIASNVLEIGVNFYFTPTGTAGADDNVYITGVQLEAGSTASPFENRSYGVELALCQRYYYYLGGETAYQNINTCVWYGAGDAVGQFSYPVTMRTNPTIAKSGTWSTLGGGGAVSQTLSNDQITTKNVQLGFAGGTGGTSGQATTLRASNDTTLRLTFNAEL
jgi:hypothetical protein